MHDIRPSQLDANKAANQPPPPQPAPSPLDSDKLLPSGLSLGSPKSGKRWKWLVAMGGVLALIVIGIVAGLYWYNAALQPMSTGDGRTRVVIAPGATAESIGHQLEEAGVVQSSLAFNIYARLHGQLASLKAGNYYLSASQSVPDIVNWLVEGKVDTYRITILPGKTLAGIKADLVKNGFSESDFEAALKTHYKHPLLADKPADVNLEGYILPDTYEVTSETTVSALFIKTFDTFYQRIQAKGLPQALAARGFNLHQAITLASLLQKEATTLADRRQTAQVFEDRLKLDMPLESDVTFMYAAGLLGVEPSTTIDSPYNTRRYKGLPPGAIASVTLDTLEAVADPAPGDYLYFVAGDDGTVHYSKTREEHEEKVRLYCTKLCQ